MPHRICVFMLTVAMATTGAAQDSGPTNQAIDAIRKADRGGAGFDQAMQAANQLRQSSIANLTVLLDGMADTNPIAENWIRGVVFDVVRRADSMPVERLATYAMDQTNNPTGRGLAMELVQQAAPEKAAELISKCLEDPSLPLREMAVQQKIENAKEIIKEKPDDAKSSFQQALVAARHPQQLEMIVQSLRKLGEEDVTIASAFAMIGQWSSLAPMDNVDGVGFHTVYAPEAEFSETGKIDLTKEHQGKSGTIQWKQVVAKDDQGVVDLAKAYDKEKGAVCYLYAEFDSARSQPAQARLGCVNANKVWINGEEVMSNEVYHSGSMIDQYVADIQLREGTNRILLKICQNEQTQSWAQDWGFQFRITDPTGKAMVSK